MSEQEFKDYQARVNLHSFLTKLKVTKYNVPLIGIKYIIASAFNLENDHNGETILVQKSCAKDSYPALCE